MIALDGITFRYNQGSSAVFEEFSWEVGRGESWAVLGPSGCGKSTLLYLLAGLRFPESGRVVIDGQELTRPRPQTGLIIQDYGLLPWATVRQNVELGMRVRRFYGPDGTHAPQSAAPDKRDIDGWLEKLGLLPLADKYPRQISGGQRQRTAIARTLSLQPDLLLMDEPFSSLDAPTRQDLQNLTLGLWAEKALTMVIVTHLIEEALTLGKRILLLGLPPNRNLVVIENPHAHDPGFLETEEYLKIRRNLHERLEVR